tara:strand:- start:311 stop:472 length:162 start_codon:yes stop_codon:yes gene_type:complete
MLEKILNIDHRLIPQKNFFDLLSLNFLKIIFQIQKMIRKIRLLIKKLMKKIKS